MLGTAERQHDAAIAEMGRGLQQAKQSSAAEVCRITEDCQRREDDAMRELAALRTQQHERVTEWEQAYRLQLEKVEGEKRQVEVLLQASLQHHSSPCCRRRKVARGCASELHDCVALVRTIRTRV